MRKLYLKMLGIALSLLAFEASAQTTYYVKTDGTTGAAATTWASASNDLQEVINAAVSGDKIFVAMGTYLPNRPANTTTVIDATNKDNAFVLKDGVSIYGGFAGGETSENQRLAGNTTILSGDLAGNDVAEIPSNTNTYMTLAKADNAYHVVLAIDINSITIFDGFTVTKGEASLNSTLMVNTKVIDNRLGGGIYILGCGANFKISNVTTTINRANGDGDTTGGGGAGFYLNSSSPTIDKCEITKSFNMNSSPKTGGYNYGSGMSLVVSSNPIITNTNFYENFGGYGGAVGIHTSNPTFTNCTFRLNRGPGRGGAVDIRVGSPTFTNCSFSENNATGAGGGAVYNYNGKGTFLNCIFYKNTTDNNGAAYVSRATSQYGANFINNTFYDNRNTRGGNAGTYAAAISIGTISTGNVYLDKKTYLYNNIFFNNVFTIATSNTNTPDLYVLDAATAIGAVNNNIFQQAVESIPVGQNNQFNLNPEFISVTPGQLTFLAPGNNSPAKDTGDDSYNATLVDFNGNARKTGTIDMGAVEYSTVLPVSFISFAARIVTAGVQLNWKVGSETNNKQFIVSRSTDGKNYSLVRKVAGVGTSAVSQSYGIVDQAVANGTYYYKLEQEDLNGDINYLATEVVKIGIAENSISVYPNPARSYVTVELKAGAYNKYHVVGLQGSTLLSGNIANADHQVKLNLSQLAQGTYIIRLTGTNGSNSSRIIKL